MKAITAVGIDLAKNVFQVCALDRNEKLVFNRKISRNQMFSTFYNLAKCRIFMESCGSSHYWASALQAAGHEVKLIHGKRVKAFVSGNKDDSADARAIVTAGLRPDTRFVPIKTSRQLELQALHRVRSRIVKERTAVVNEMRGLLYEHGFTIPQGVEKAEKGISELLAGEDLSALMRQIIQALYSEYLAKKKSAKEFDALIKAENQGDEMVKRLQTIPGVGPLTASAIVADCNPGDFKNGRGYAASLGLVPKHTGSGGKITSLSISKRGDAYIRTLLIHGARSIMRFTSQKRDRQSLWCEALRERRGDNKAAVALAHKTARIIWRVMNDKSVYDAAKAA